MRKNTINRCIYVIALISALLTFRENNVYALAPNIYLAAEVLGVRGDDVTPIQYGFAYAGTQTNPATMYKVSLSTGAISSQVLTTVQDIGERFGSIDKTNNWAYFTAETVPGADGCVLKISTEDLSSYTCTEYGYTYGSSITVLDSSNRYLYVGRGGTIMAVQKIDTSTMTQVGYDDVPFGDGGTTRRAGCLMLDEANNHLYVASTTISGGGPRVFRYLLDPFGYSGGYWTFPAAGSNDDFLSCAIDTTNKLIYVSTNTGPQEIIRLNYDTSTQDVLTTSIASSSIDVQMRLSPDNNYLYFSNGFAAGSVNFIKVDTSTFTEVGTLKTSTPRNFGIDEFGWYAYVFPSASNPAISVVELSSFTIINTVTATGVSPTNSISFGFE